MSFQVLQAGPGSSAALGIAPSPVPHLHASSCLCSAPLKSDPALGGAAAYGSTFHFVQLQLLAASTPAVEFKTFYNNYCYSCRHFSIFVFQSSLPSDSNDVMAERSPWLY